ncbi:hypothetical protein hmeg3_09810 [Herbaspirillum sp. meg3]|nr:hypothetical protein hmeg3_09810 [Herbaspirillum sp. meg3]
MVLMVFLGGAMSGSEALAQARVDRTLSVQSGAASSLGDLPIATTNAITATTTTTTAPVTPAASTPSHNPAPSSHNRPSGSYASDAMGATILAKNADYETLFRINAPIPAGSTISNVAWRYGLSSKPVGFEAVLCRNNQQRCWNITNSASGNTSAFNGQDASQPFTLHYRVRGTGPLGPPAQGEMNQVIVTYDLPG